MARVCCFIGLQRRNTPHGVLVQLPLPERRRPMLSIRQTDPIATHRQPASFRCVHALALGIRRRADQLPRARSTSASPRQIPRAPLPTDLKTVRSAASPASRLPRASAARLPPRRPQLKAARLRQADRSPLIGQRLLGVDLMPAPPSARVWPRAWPCSHQSESRWLPGMEARRRAPAARWRASRSSMSAAATARQVEAAQPRQARHSASARAWSKRNAPTP